MKFKVAEKELEVNGDLTRDEVKDIIYIWF